MSLVLNHSRAQGTDKVVLLGIANHDGDGGAWPSITTLARYANVSESAVIRSLRRLEATGELTTHLNGGGTVATRNDRRPNRYEITLSTGVAPTLPRKPPRGSVCDVHGVAPTPPEPSLEPSLITSPCDLRARREAVLRIYAQMMYERARNVTSPTNYIAEVKRRASTNPNLDHWLTHWPTAPPSAVAGWLTGDKHSMGYYPEALE